MERDRAQKELQARLTNVRLIRHSLEVEAIMRELASILRDNIELWGLAGLLHDIDIERTEGEPSMHSIVGSEILENLDIDPEVVYAVKAHNDIHGIERKRKLDKALYCSDPMSWLIDACVRSLPSQKLSDVTADYILSKFNDAGFASELKRDQIRTCRELGIPLEEFAGIALAAVQKI